MCACIHASKGHIPTYIASQPNYNTNNRQHSTDFYYQCNVRKLYESDHFSWNITFWYYVGI